MAGDVLGYVFELAPAGFVVVTAETRLVPVIAHSESAQFSWEETPLNALLWILRTDLRLRMTALRDGVYERGEVEANEARWAAYLSGEDMSPRATTWGPWITTPTWNQDSPYWNRCPMDPVTGERCYVGCGATALAQILNYWQFPLTVTFTEADDYTSASDPGDGHGERVIAIDATEASIPLINFGNGRPSDTMKAAISFAAGVSVQMDYTSAGSGASCANVASALAGGIPDWSWVVPERWGYLSADFRTTDPDWQPWPPYYATTEEILSLLQNDAAAAYPSIITIQSDESGHYVVVDGYKTTGDYHVNFGWGGTSDGWYSLPAGLPEGYNVVDTAVVNIVPPSPPSDTAAEFRVSDSGDVFADAGLFGTSYAAGSADIAEWVAVSESVGPGDVLELDPAQPGSYRRAGDPCSGLVAGVVSSQPGVVLGVTGAVDDKALMALAGIVAVRVTSEGGPIGLGDLLVSSSTPGYAMRWSGSDPCPCALVGKALGPFDGARGAVLVLLTVH